MTERLAELGIPDGAGDVHGTAFVAATVEHRQVGGELETKRQRPVGSKSVGKIGDAHVFI